MPVRCKTLLSTGLMPRMLLFFVTSIGYVEPFLCLLSLSIVGINKVLHSLLLVLWGSTFLSKMLRHMLHYYPPFIQSA